MLFLEVLEAGSEGALVLADLSGLLRAWGQSKRPSSGLSDLPPTSPVILGVAERTGEVMTSGVRQLARVLQIPD